MPSGRVHDQVTIVTGVAVAAGGLALGVDEALLITGVAGHVLSGLAFSPDLDLTSHTRRWGVLSLFWLPYALIVPHRSWLSHSLIIGPLLRLTYFLLIVSGILYALLAWAGRPDMLRFILEAAHWFMQQHKPYVVVVLAGFISGGALHSLVDMMVSAANRKV